MAHLLPAAGRDKTKAKEFFRFYRVQPLCREKGFCEGYDCENIPTDIGAYKWTDFAKEAEFCERLRREYEAVEKAKHHRNPHGHQSGPSQNRHQGIQTERASCGCDHTCGCRPPPHYGGHPPHGVSQRVTHHVSKADATDLTWCLPTGFKSHPQNSSNNNGNLNNNHHWDDDAEETEEEEKEGCTETCGKPPLCVPACGCYPGPKRPECPGVQVPIGWCWPTMDFGSVPRPRTPPPECLTPEQLAGTGWGYCPPCGVDPRTLIRPRDKTLPDSTRPTGAPYFNHSSKVPVPQLTSAIKGGFNYCDWLETQEAREPPAHLRPAMCIPSLCTWCAPQYVDCCPDYRNPRAYVIAKMD